jgi:hypothetical protein
MEKCNFFGVIGIEAVRLSREYSGAVLYELLKAKARFKIDKKYQP